MRADAKAFHVLVLVTPRQKAGHQGMFNNDRVQHMGYDSDQLRYQAIRDSSALATNLTQWFIRESNLGTHSYRRYEYHFCRQQHLQGKSSRRLVFPLTCNVIRHADTSDLGGSIWNHG